MIIDKKGKLFGKISIVDICVVLVIIVGIVGAYFAVSVLNSGKLDRNSKVALNSDAPLQTATVSLTLREVRSVTKDALIVGDEIFTTDTDSKLIGVIKEIISEPSTKNVAASDGTVYNAEIPEKFNVTIIVDVTGKSTGTGFYTDSGVRLLYGEFIEIKTSTVKTTPEVAGVVINK